MLKAIHLDRENLGQLFTKKFLLVILISIPSAIIADFFNIPLAWMIGPMIATSLIALNGFQVLMPKIALSSILIILGLHIGNYIDQNLFSQMVNWIWTTVIMFFYIVVSILIVSKYLQKSQEYRHVLRRIFICEKLPYSEIQDNTISKSLIPVDMLRLKLSFFGATRFDPRSDRWVRITMYQGAPLMKEISLSDDTWSYKKIA
jgi:uncharacterized membrane protein